MTRICTLFTLMLLASCLRQSGNTNSQPQVEPLAKSDQELLWQTFQSIKLISMMSEEATTRSAVADTKQLANELLHDDKSILAELSTLAGKHNAELPLDITGEQQRRWRALITTRGILFDRNYATTIQAEYNELNKMLKNKIGGVKNEQLQQTLKRFLTASNNHDTHTGELLVKLESRKSRDTLPPASIDSFVAPE